MLVLLLFATAASITASLVIGIRLLRLALRTRELPETMIGSSFILAGVVGYVLMVVGNPQGGALTAEQSLQVTMLGYGLIGCGVCFLYVFIWRTFRPTSRVAGTLAIVAGIAVLLTTRATIDREAADTVPYFVGIFVRLASGAWGAFESLQWWSRMRKRLAIGLGDPVVTNRFLLWGLANVTTFVIFASTIAMPRTTEDPSLSSNLMIVISLLTIVAAAVQWLAFFPTQRYRRWVRGSAGTATA